MSDPVVLPETAALLALLAAQPGPHLADMPADVAREAYRQMGTLFDAPADPAVRTVEFSGGGCALRAYFPGAPVPGPVIVYMHGGGWVIGDLETHHGLCALIARVTGLRVVAVDYRLAPEHPFPAAHEDCLAAATFVAAGPAVLEAPVAGIAVAGDSAGGNLAFHVATQLTTAPVLGQLLIYPVGDCTSPETGSYRQFAEGYLLDRRLMDRFIADYLPDPASRARPALSPVLHPLPARVPPAVILTAGLDMLRDQGRALADGIVGRGGEVHFVEAEGLIHGLATMRQALPTGDTVIRQAVGIFAAMIGANRNK
jgi:acetyl esterase